MKRILIFLTALVSLSLSCYSQDTLKKVTVGTGGGFIYYPEGKIYGLTHNYNVDYIFANHFGAKLSFDFAEGQNNEKYYFDFSRSTILGIGLVYIPIQKKRNFSINTSFTIHNNTRIFGTKDEIVSSSFALSEFASYEKFILYGLNIGIQCPMYKKIISYLQLKLMPGQVG